MASRNESKHLYTRWQKGIAAQMEQFDGNIAYINPMFCFFSEINSFRELFEATKY